MDGTDPMDLAALRYVVFAIFGTPLFELDRAFSEVLVDHDMAPRFQRSTGTLNLEWVSFGEPPRGGAHATRAILFEPSAVAESTVFVANLRDGWLTMVNCLAQKVSCVAVMITSSGGEEIYPVQRFELWENGKSQRIVQLLRDTNRWEFVQRGQLHPIEHPNNYDGRRKRDRLTRADLVRYMRSLGFDFALDEFWRAGIPAIYHAATRH